WLEKTLNCDMAYHHNGKAWPTHYKEHVWEAISKNRAFLWPGETCVLVTEILTAPTGLKSHNTWLAGGNLDEIVRLTPSVEAWGRAQGCHRQLGTGRRGWLKVLSGYKECAVRRSKDMLT